MEDGLEGKKLLETNILVEVIILFVGVGVGVGDGWSAGDCMSLTEWTIGKVLLQKCFIF